jgi:hypothetical protein
MENRMTEQKEIATRPAQAKAAAIAMDATGLQLKTLDDAYRFAQYVVASKLAPQGDTAESVLIKLQAGAELGLPPMRSLSCLVVVNGKLSMEGVAVLALCRASGKFSKLKTGADGEGDSLSGFVDFARKDTGETDIVRFSMADAKRSKLDTKETYRSYPKDMLMWKAVSRFGKQYAADIIMGIDVSEVAPDNRPITVAPETRPALPPADDTPDPIFDAEESARIDAEIVENEAKETTTRHVCVEGE